MNKIILGALISSCWVNLACGMNGFPGNIPPTNGFPGNMLNPSSPMNGLTPTPIIRSDLNFYPPIRMPENLQRALLSSSFPASNRKLIPILVPVVPGGLFSPINPTQPAVGGNVQQCSKLPSGQQIVQADKQYFSNADIQKMVEERAKEMLQKELEQREKQRNNNNVETKEQVKTVDESNLTKQSPANQVVRENAVNEEEKSAVSTIIYEKKETINVVTEKKSTEDSVFCNSKITQSTVIDEKEEKIKSCNSIDEKKPKVQNNAATEKKTKDDSKVTFSPKYKRRFKYLAERTYISIDAGTQKEVKAKNEEYSKSGQNIRAVYLKTDFFFECPYLNWQKQLLSLLNDFFNLSDYSSLEELISLSAKFSLYPTKNIKRNHKPMLSENLDKAREQCNKILKTAAKSEELEMFINQILHNLEVARVNFKGSAE